MAKLRDFNWSLLNRTNIIQMVLLCKELVVDIALPVNDLHKILSLHIKTYLPITVQKYRRKTNERGVVYVGGSYHSDSDQSSARAINLILQYHPTDTHIKLSSLRFKKLALVIADTVLHEIIHMRQYRRRQFKELPDYNSTALTRSQRIDQQYLGRTDEIDAYSFNIACELLDKFKGNAIAITEYLNSPQILKEKRQNNWQKYLQVFNNDHSHKIIKNVKKRTIFYLPYALTGKPFKSASWLIN